MRVSYFQISGNREKSRSGKWKYQFLTHWKVISQKTGEESIALASEWTLTCNSYIAFIKHCILRLFTEQYSWILAGLRKAGKWQFCTSHVEAQRRAHDGPRPPCGPTAELVKGPKGVEPCWELSYLSLLPVSVPDSYHFLKMSLKSR